MLKRSFSAIALSLLFSAVAIANPITYTLEQFNVVLGTVTTDGTLGSISTSDILSWSWSFNQFSGSSAIPGSVADLNGSLVATTDQLYLQFPPFIPPGGLVAANFDLFSPIPHSADAETLQFFANTGIPGQFLTVPDYNTTAYVFANDTQNFINLPVDYGATPPPLGFRITPEPSSIALLVIGAIGLAAISRRSGVAW